MQSALVVVVPASQPSCPYCNARTDWNQALCPACRNPQPVTAEARAATPFALLGVLLRFQQDPDHLQKRFYTLSRELHPDRFAAGAPAVRAASLERMSLINSAYQTLQDPTRLRTWVLSHFGVAIPKTLPMAWAERWFEVQDSGDRSVIEGFAQDLTVEIARCRDAFATLQAAADEQWSAQGEAVIPQSLQEIAAAEGLMSYLLSLQREVGRTQNGH